MARLPPRPQGFTMGTRALHMSFKPQMAQARGVVGEPVLISDRAKKPAAGTEYRSTADQLSWWGNPAESAYEEG